jgi:hypothetical protein
MDDWFIQKMQEMKQRKLDLKRGQEEEELRKL